MKWLFLIAMLGMKPSDSSKPFSGKNQISPSTYQKSILPILISKCNPCHFPGGKIYERYPFDNFETVSSLGLKLNTRLKGKDADIVKQWVKTGKPER